MAGMTTIILSPSQAQVLREHPGDVKLCDETGQELAVAVTLHEGPATKVSLAPDEIDRLGDTNATWLSTSEMIAEIKSRVAQR
jgi:hypothetical protein